MTKITASVLTNNGSSYPDLHEMIRSHVGNIWPSRKIDPFVWPIGSIARSIPDFQVLRISPNKAGEPWIYVSSGAWEVDAPLGERMEFFLLSPIESPEHVETLAMLANFHADDPCRVQFGKSVNIGRPWIEGSNCDRLLVSAPYPIDPRFESLSIPNSSLKIQFVWLMPITADEAQFAASNGVEALEQLFEQQQVDCLDIDRKSIAL